MTLRFDITLPYYGDVPLMIEAVRSVLAQGGEDWHLTVHDDGTPDPRPQRFFEALGDPRVTYVRYEENVGANQNFRRALERARGDYVVFMGADDLMRGDYLDRMRTVCAAFPHAVAIQPGVRVIDGRGQAVQPLVDRVKGTLRPRTAGSAPALRAGEQLAASLARGNWTYFPSICWRRSAVAAAGFRRGLDVAQDLGLLMDLVLADGAVVIDSEPTFWYRRHRASDSSLRALTGSRFTEEREFFKEMAAAFEARGWPVAARAARWHLTSRLHAASLLPRALSPRHRGAARVLLGHVTG